MLETVIIHLNNPFPHQFQSFSGRGAKGEAVIQLSFAKGACAIKWGELSKLPKAVFKSEVKKAVQEVFQGMVIPDPLEMVFKYWENVAW